MLTQLSIQNVVIIEKLVIEFENGLCALTGETGAGKSILLDSLGLALGKRADAAFVRKGADKASVSASFSLMPSHPALTFLKNHDLDITEELLVLRRSVRADGRSQAYVNDQTVSVGLLKALGAMLVEIHGQFDTQGLLDPKTHGALLDGYAAVDTAAIEKLWGVWQQKKQAYLDIKDLCENARIEEEYLRGALEDLDGLEPVEGEESTLSALKQRLKYREQVLEGLNTAYDALNTDADPVRRAWSDLERLSDKLGDDGDKAIAALARANSEMEEATALIQGILEDIAESDHDLQSVDDRLFALRTQARKHKCNVDDLILVREKLAQDLNAIEHADETLEKALKEVELAQGAFVKEASVLHEVRMKAAKKLDDLVQKELPPLKLERSRFLTCVEEKEESAWGPRGFSQSRFLVATNPGSDPGPLGKIASGGEMSRFMLALKVVLAEIGFVETLIFDEVDAGVGGATADAVGQRLARLAKMRQILVVTHSPQVAARAGHHWIVQKAGDSSKVSTDVVQLPDLAQRCEEIARMIAGEQVSEEARAAANKLLKASLETEKAA